MSVNAKMTAIADAIRGKTGGTAALSLDEMAAQIAGIETDPVLESLAVTENGAYTPGEGVDGFSAVTVNVQSAGGAGGGLELIYETTFTLEESQVSVGAVDIVQISTGLTAGSFDGENEVMVVIQCVNDTDTDTSYNHFQARTQGCYVSAGYGTRIYTSGCGYTNGKYAMYAYNAGVYVRTAGTYLGTITLATNTNYATFGIAPSGDYRLRVYAVRKDFFGIEGEWS